MQHGTKRRGGLCCLLISLLCLVTAFAFSACGGDESGHTVSETGHLYVVLEGLPDDALGETGDVCLVGNTGALYRRSETGWEEREYSQKTIDGNTLFVTYTDGSTGEYEAVPLDGDDHIHQFGDIATINEPQCVVPGVGIRTCTICGRSQLLILPADATNHQYDYSRGVCLICGGPSPYL